MGSLLDFLVVAVAVAVAETFLPGGLVNSPWDCFLAAARVLAAGLSENSSSLITVLALPLAFVEFFFVSFLIAVGALATGFCGGGFLATPADFFAA